VVPRELPGSTNGGELAIFLGFSAYLFSGDRMRIDMVGVVTLILVFLAWLVFGAIFLFRKKPPKAEETKRVAAAKWGIALQGVGFALVGSFHRAQWWPLPPTLFGEVIFAAATVALAYSSCLFCLRAVRTLGKQWTYEARVIQGHELITQGPYGLVRNPIYLGMFGLMVATGLAYSTWWALGAAILVFLVGNRIRIRAEEKLLREAFGERFDDYARRVPAFFPRHV
jgi:protein-S-isoprenylcysteine O-methyltransferase Ste14